MLPFAHKKSPPPGETMRQKTEQELFWEGQFGTDYTTRNRDLSQSRQPFWGEILKISKAVHSICELGSNRGENLDALRALDAKLNLTGVEINPTACEHLRAIADVHACQSSIQDFQTEQRFDLVFTSGVLIHLNPDDLPMIYRKMDQLSSRYVLINEYYNPHPTEIDYRGHTGKLFKRDFAGEFLDMHDGQFSVASYGFLWNRLHPAWDNTTWVLMEKNEIL
jgi:pseudaminic acid biosynthesis-associated methylase